MSKALSEAANLILQDAQKKIMDPNFRRREKQMGLLPKNQDSPFGDFPAEFKRHSRQAWEASTEKRRAAESAEVIAAEPVRKEYLKKGVGTGGLPCAALVCCDPYSPTPSSSCSPVVASDEARTARHLSPSAGLRTADGLLGAWQQRKSSQCPSSARQKIAPSELRRYYDRGDLAMSVLHGASANKVNWRIDIDKLDYHHYLPILFDGLREKEDPYRFLAVQGVYDLIERGRGGRLVAVVPQIIIPIKRALNTRDAEVIATVLKALQTMVLTEPDVGKALVPYYRQILPIFNIFKRRNVNTGDAMDYGQRNRQNLGELIEETLQIFEVHGGEDAFINIKYMIPTYESNVLC